jgi:hypothetical protein
LFTPKHFSPTLSTLQSFNFLLNTSTWKYVINTLRLTCSKLKSFVFSVLFH